MKKIRIFAKRNNRYSQNRLHDKKCRRQSLIRVGIISEIQLYKQLIAHNDTSR